MPIHKNNIIVQYLIQALELRQKITNEIEAIMAITENVFKPLFQFLRKQKIDLSFQIGSPGESAVKG